MSIQQSPTRYLRRPSLNRTNGLRKLGVSEDDVIFAEKLLEQISSYSTNKKTERVLGYASTRMKREKAIRLLGVTEDDVAVEIPKVLGTLGIAGRRRSYSTTTPPAFIQAVNVRSISSPPAQRRSTVQNPSVHRLPRNDPRRRSSESDVRCTADLALESNEPCARRGFLMGEDKNSTSEVESLKAKIMMLEERLAALEVEKMSTDATNRRPIPMLIENIDAQSIS
ncbi:hypothetical protein ACHAXA_004326 [Cyclostephanos tholiformis]|uniref:Uncharacterized protein n=1 Tax=Cyclostephanos tholiformis TaxID=382380 RepID=A0ABD3SPH5_9STRA